MPIKEVCAPFTKWPKAKPFSNAQTVRSAGVKHPSPWGPPATDAGRANVQPYVPKWDKTDRDPAHGDK